MLGQGNHLPSLCHPHVSPCRFLAQSQVQAIKNECYTRPEQYLCAQPGVLEIGEPQIPGSAPVISVRSRRF